MALPKYLYKYKKIDIYSEEIICHNTIYLSSPTKFNDPFDSSSDLISIPTSQAEAKKIFDILDKSKQDEILKFKLKGLKKDNNKYDYYAHLMSMIKGIDSKLSNIGICCFSEMNDNILTWSHYADNHKGICIQFKPNYSKYPFNLIQEVDYSEDKPKLNYLTSDILSILKIKYKDWHYENEFRIIDQNNTNIAIELEPDEISGVVIGFKTPEDDVKKIFSWIKRSKSHILRYKATKAFKEYSLKVDYYADPERKFLKDLARAFENSKIKRK